MVENARLLWLIQDPSDVTIEEVGNNTFRYELNKMWERDYDIGFYAAGGTPTGVPGSSPATSSGM
jgi:hypothetical protein